MCLICTKIFVSLGTHDVQGLQFTSPDLGDMRVTGDFVQGSTATGVVIADLVSSEIHFYLLAREIEQLELDDTISNLVDGQHTVSAFVIDEQGFPFRRTATLPQNVLVVKGIIKNIIMVEVCIILILLLLLHICRKWKSDFFH